MKVHNASAQQSNDEFKLMSERELLEAIWESESSYKSDEDRAHDHRQYLSRGELEITYKLTRRLARLKANSRTATVQNRH